MLSRGAAPPSGRATRSVAQNEARKRRASKRRYVGSCNELAGPTLLRYADLGTARAKQLRVRSDVLGHAVREGFRGYENNFDGLADRMGAWNTVEEMK